MNTYKVLLRDRPDEFVVAHRYRREGDQYVFEDDEDSEVQFFDAAEVVGVTIVPPEGLDSASAGS